MFLLAQADVLFKIRSFQNCLSIYWKERKIAISDKYILYIIFNARKKSIV